MNTTDRKIVDENNFWLMKDNPMTKIGVFPYLGRQISPELEPNKVYQVLRPREELTKPETLESLKLIPLVDEHTMLGTLEGFKPAEKKGVHGVTGTNVKVNGNIISNDLKVFSETLKELIENGKKGLSLGYTSRYDLTSGEYQGQHYDAIQRDVIFNHLALVEEGRMGKDVRVMDSSITYDSIADILQTKENNMAENEKSTCDVDKREFIREVMAIAAKPDDEFEGGEEEKVETIAKKLEELAYNPSEAGTNDEDINIEINQNGEEGKEEAPQEEIIADEEPEQPTEDEDEDKRKLIDEIGGILKDKVDEELWRTVIGKAEKLAYNDSETGANDEDDTENPEKDKKEGVSMDEAIKYLAKKDALIKKIRPYIGDSYRYPSMTIKEVVKYACDKLDIKPSLDALEGYIKAKNQTRAKMTMDCAFTKPAVSSVLQQYKSGK